MPTISIDGVSYEAEEGRTLLQALDDLGVLMNGVDIPHYCWHPKLSIDGSCRLCQVEIEGVPKLQIACDTPVRDGMIVHTKNERVRRAREGVMELLLVNHPLDCPICDQAGECKLQDYAFEFGMNHARSEEPRRAAKKRVALGPTIMFDQERCILCRRCVRFCREIPQTGELAVLARGDRSVIETFPGAELDNDYSMNVADLCPVGALTTRDFRFKIRVWFLDPKPGVCTGCARGCNVSIGVADNRAYRYTPRRNDAVNETWICDEGRLSYTRINAEDRIESAQVRDATGVLRPVDTDHAIAEGARRLREVGERDSQSSIGIWVSPHSTNEDLFAAKKFAEVLGAPAGFAVALGRGDDRLIHTEKAANATGARALGFGDGGALLDGVAAASIKALVMIGHDAMGSGLLDDVGPLRGLETLVLLDTHRSALEEIADVVVPIRHTAEKLGTLTNCASHLQRVEPALEAVPAARDEGEICWRLAAAMGLSGFDRPYDTREISKRVAAEVPIFFGLDVSSVGASGRPAHQQIAGNPR